MFLTNFHGSLLTTLHFASFLIDFNSDLKARLNGFNLRSTQLLNQMSGAFEQVIEHCWKLVESVLNQI